MYILTEDKEQIVNTKYIKSFWIVQVDAMFRVIAVYNDPQTIEATLSVYKDMKKAKDILSKLAAALASGMALFDMSATDNPPGERNNADHGQCGVSDSRLERAESYGGDEV